MLNYLSQKFRESFNAQEASKFFVGHYASIEIVMVLNRECRLNYPRQLNCLLQMFRCKFIILFYDNGA